MFSTTYPKFSSRGDPRGSRSSSHKPLLPVLNLTSAIPGKSIHVPVNCVPILMHRSYHNVFPDVSYVFPKGFPKIHPDAPRNACGVRTAAGRVCRVITPRSPTQVTIHHNNLMFIMFHVTVDIRVQTVSWFMPSIIGNLWIFAELSVDIIDWISPAWVLTWTRPGLPFFLIRRNPRVNLTNDSDLTWFLIRVLIRLSLPPNPS
jgi:hypothetical protein